MPAQFRIALALHSEIIPPARRFFLGVHRFAHTRTDWDLVWRDGTTLLPWRSALDSKPDGILGVLSSRDGQISAADFARQHVVILNTFPCPCHLVISDSLAAARRAAAYLLERRLRHFAFVGWGGMYFSELRKKGFQQALREAGHLERVEGLDFSQPTVPPKQIGAWLHRLRVPCGILCANDQLALHTITAALDAGLDVPVDLAVLGIGNDEMVCAESPVPISSVEQHFEEVGFRAAQFLDDLLRGKPAPPTPLLIPPGEIVERGSTRVLGVEDPLVRQALTIIREPRSEPLTMPLLMARLGNVSQRLLELRFKEVLGRSPYQEILCARISHAKRLLRSTRYSLEEIAEQTGFGDPSVFSRHFRKICQQTASQYRRDHRAR